MRLNNSVSFQPQTNHSRGPSVFGDVLYLSLDIKRSTVHTLIVLSPSLFPSIDLNCQGQKSYHQRKEPIWGSFLQKILRREREFREGPALPYGGDVERGYEKFCWWCSKPEGALMRREDGGQIDATKIASPLSFLSLRGLLLASVFESQWSTHLTLWPIKWSQFTPSFIPRIGFITHCIGTHTLLNLQTTPTSNVVGINEMIIPWGSGSVQEQRRNGNVVHLFPNLEHESEGVHPLVNIPFYILAFWTFYLSKMSFFYKP